MDDTKVTLHVEKEEPGRNKCHAVKNGEKKSQ